MLEGFLNDRLHENIRSYSDGANPLMSLQHRILADQPQSQYLTTLPDRSRQADYTKVRLPAFYYRRVARDLGVALNIKDDDIKAKLKKIIARQTSSLTREEWQNRVDNTRKLVEAIQRKGGTVIFIGMPTSGMVKELEARRYPKAVFWDYFAKHIGAPSLHSNYTPGLDELICPDGSHLDFRDQAAFTGRVVSMIKPFLAK